ncbi:hypothetical protein PIB30_040431 [Stylosanthes scabra]|uniref:Transposase-associated domain-containing protein n=1 Tax=Stylosanthes scabra TaxID=79078 RepID=A0ABU6TE92_9FABA|nr:hypothetical protein [Stylosanthes scabra]
MNGVDGFVAYVFTLEEFRVAGISRCPCSKCCLLNWIGPQEMTLHLEQRRSERVSRVTNLNTETPFGEVNWEDNHERYNKMIMDAFGMDVEVFRETHTRKRDRSIVEKRAEDLLTEFSANLNEATQRAQEEGDESPATVDPDIVWRQTLSEPYKNRVYGAGGFFASLLRRSSYADSSKSTSSCHTGPPAPEVVDLREQVQNLTQSLQSQGDLLQQQIDEVKSLKSTLAEKDAQAEEHLRCMEEMSRMMAAYYGPLRPGSSGSGAGLDSTTAPPLPPRPPPRHPYPEGDDDDDDYEDA